MKPIPIEDARSAEDYRTARTLFEEYARTIGADLCFQDFSEELERLSSIYAPPGGGLLLARRDGRAVGCVAMRPFEPGTCEMKRLYVRPEARVIYRSLGFVQRSPYYDGPPPDVTFMELRLRPDS